MVKTLTDRFVAGVRPKGRSTNVFDTKARGLALYVGRRTKVWFFVYRHGGPSQWLRLGEYPALTLAAARTRVHEERVKLDKGIDPVEEQRTPPVEPEPHPPVFTFADFVPVYVTFQKGRTREWADEESKIHRHLMPAWATLPLRDIKRTHVHELLDTVVGKGLTTGTNRIQAVVSRMFTVALDRSLIDAHPSARMIKRFEEHASDRVLSDEELRALWKGLDARPGAASDAVRLRLLLGQRGGETAGMLWQELDLETATWLLPSTRTKNKRPHVVPLPASALAVLTKCRKRVPNNEPAVFPGLSSARDDYRALGVIHGGAYEWPDLRRTVGTRLAGLGFDATTRGRVLNHARYGVTDKHYNVHEYDDEKRRALTAWDQELERIVANVPRPRARVVPLRRRR